MISNIEELLQLPAASRVSSLNGRALWPTESRDSLLIAICWPSTPLYTYTRGVVVPLLRVKETSPNSQRGVGKMPHFSHIVSQLEFLYRLSF